MNRKEKTIQGMECCLKHEAEDQDKRIFDYYACEYPECPYFAENSSCFDRMRDALYLLKAQDEVIKALLKVGYPHDFQREKPWIVNYMYAITEVIKKAVRLHNG